uniref:ZP domain-containing protein n=1 Tax=Parastrongyloides trichosuri TaxID=131310 RepID=A0A0N5A7G4_PARTI
MIKETLIIVLVINVIKGSIRRGENFLGYYCYGADYIMVVTGNVSCNGTLYNGSTIAIKECETANIICNKNISNVPLIGNTFNYSVKLFNERKVEFYLIIEIRHKCCDSPYKTMTYSNDLKKPLQSYNFKCGNFSQNVKNYGTIELPIKSTVIN